MNKKKQKIFKIKGDFNDVIKTAVDGNPSSPKKTIVKKFNNYAFIDGQNIYAAMRDIGWKLDFTKFRVYLKDNYNVSKAFYFVGYVEKNKDIYEQLKKRGYIMIYKPTMPTTDDSIKGNCDADLVLYAMITFKQYNQAIIVASDGDYYSLARHLREKNKLKRILVPTKSKCSSLLKWVAMQFISEIKDLRKKLEYIKV